MSVSLSTDEDDGSVETGVWIEDDDPNNPCEMQLDANEIKWSSARLHWFRCRDAEFSSYKLYRSTEENFVPSEATYLNRGAVESDRAVIEHRDTGLLPDTTYYYILRTTHGGTTDDKRVSITTSEQGAPNVEFEGDAYACAGGVADNVHTFTVSAIAKNQDGTIAPNVALEFKFENNKGHINRAKYLPNIALSQVSIPGSNNGEMTATTNEQGRISISVRSSDIVSDDIKMLAVWTNAQNAEKKVGEQECEFAPARSYRRFAVKKNAGDENIAPDEDNGTATATEDEDIDDGWLFRFEQLSAPDATVPAKVYMKILKGPDLTDIDGNWHFVNDHWLLIQIVGVILNDGTVVEGTPTELKDFAYVLNANPSQAEPLNPEPYTDLVRTGEFANVNNIRDGAAQATVKAGPRIGEVLTLLVGAEELTQLTD